MNYREWSTSLPRGTTLTYEQIYLAGYKEGMMEAAEIAKNAVKPTGCKEYDWDRSIGALDACAAIKAEREELE